jgi:hypothetical protein
MRTIDARELRNLVGYDDGIGSVAIARPAGLERFDQIGASTDVGDYAEHVNTLIETLDRDVQAAVDKGGLGPQFDPNAWYDFVQNPDQINGFEYDATDVAPAPFGWRPYYKHIGGGLLITAAGNKSDAMVHIGNYEKAYADYYDAFAAAGGTTLSERPKHPGTFETPLEQQTREQSETPWSWYAKAGLVLLGIGVTGYLVTGAARLKGG